MSKLGAAFTVDDTTGRILSPSVGVGSVIAAATDDTSLSVESAVLTVKTRNTTTRVGGVSAAKVDKSLGTVIQAALATGAGGGGVFSVLNGSGVDLTAEVDIDITTASGAATVDVGVGASATTLYDTLIDGLSTASTGAFSSRSDAGTNGKAQRRWPNGQYITASQASGSVAGLVGTYRIRAWDPAVAVS